MLAHRLAVVDPQLLGAQHEPEELEQLADENLVDRARRVGNDFHEVREARAEVAVVFEAVAEAEAVEENREAPEQRHVEAALVRRQNRVVDAVDFVDEVAQNRFHLVHVVVVDQSRHQTEGLQQKNLHVQIRHVPALALLLLTRAEGVVVLVERHDVDALFEHLQVAREFFRGLGLEQVAEVFVDGDDELFVVFHSFEFDAFFDVVVQNVENVQNDFRVRRDFQGEFLADDLAAEVDEFDGVVRENLFI